MVDFLTQYAPFIVTGVGVITPILPTMIVKAVQDRKAIATFESIKVESREKLDEIKGLAQNIKERETLITKEVSEVRNMTSNFKGQIDRIETSVDQKMKEVSDSVLAFQNDEIYQKMLNGLSQLDEIQHTMKLKDELIEKQAQVIKEIHKKLGA